MNKLCSSSSVILITCTLTSILLCVLIPSSVNSLDLDQVSSETTTVTSPDSLDEQSASGETTTINSQDAEEQEPNDYVNTRSKPYADCQCGIANPGIPIREIISIISKRERRAGSKFAVPPNTLEPFIIPAEEAGVREYPWMAAITKKKWDGRQHVVCGGSLINSRFVITAAHCVKNQPLSRMEVAFNVHNTTSMKQDGEVEIRKIKRLIVHPGWNQQTVDNDIALIELSAPIDFSQSRARPICLPANHSHSDFDGQNATVSGWGYTVPSGPNSNVLNKIVVPIISEKKCREETIYKEKVLPSMLCAGYLEGGKDACTNDSGGPLIVQEGDKNILVGLVSWGHGCARRLAPGVYTRVTRYVDWIEEKVTRGDWCQVPNH